jgi:hypothetical protein
VEQTATLEILLCKLAKTFLYSFVPKVEGPAGEQTTDTAAASEAAAARVIMMVAHVPGPGPGTKGECHPGPECGKDNAGRSEDLGEDKAGRGKKAKGGPLALFSVSLVSHWQPV